MSIASGIDGQMPRQLRALPVSILLGIHNFIMWCEWLLIDARTIFIPNKPDAVDPADFRPTTICSALAKLFHRILAKRIDSAVELFGEQRALAQASMVVKKSTVLLNSILRGRFELSKSIYIATFDIAEAFPSVNCTIQHSNQSLIWIATHYYYSTVVESW